MMGGGGCQIHHTCKHRYAHYLREVKALLTSCKYTQIYIHVKGQERHFPTFQKHSTFVSLQFKICLRILSTRTYMTSTVCTITVLESCIINASVSPFIDRATCMFY